MARINDLHIGAHEDTIRLRVAGQQIKIAENYEVKLNILQQPSAFTLRLGSAETAAEILKRCSPISPFELYIGPSQIMSGRVYSRGCPSISATMVEIKGRDHIAALFDDEIQSDYTFPDKTYYDLTRKVLNIVGMREQTAGPTPKFVLYTDNDANRALISKVATTKGRKKGQLATQIRTGATDGAGQVVYQTIKATVGTSWFQFLQQQYKLAGLFLWATGEGNFVLAQPRADQEPAYKIHRTRGERQDFGNIVACRYQDDVTFRHSACIVHGRGGVGKNGRAKIEGYYADPEMADYGFNHVRVVQDDDVKTVKEAEYVARKTLAEERRAGWQLEYTMSGHVIPSLKGKDGSAIWCPDMVCRVDDEELDIHGNFYIEGVTFSRGSETTTTVTLMRPEDLIFADGLFS